MHFLPYDAKFYCRKFLNSVPLTLSFGSSGQSTTAQKERYEVVVDIVNSLIYCWGTREGGCEAPLLFVLFIADLIEHLEKVQLSSDPVFFGK